MILLDLFSGIGGFHKGLSDAGFNFSKVYFSEINKYAIANYKYNYPNAEHIGTVESILNTGIERPDIITFGSPCQDFSLAGKRAGLSGERSSLIEHAIAAISHFRPDIFIWENVKGTFSSNAGSDFWAIIQAFANIGDYQIEWQLLDTAWILPQHRERIYLVGRLADRCRGEVFPIGENDELFRKKAGFVSPQICSTITSNFAKMGGDNTYVKVGTFRTHKDGKGFRQVKSVVCPTIPARAREDGSGMPVVVHRSRGNNKGGNFDICPTISTSAFEQNNFISSFTRDAQGKIVNRNKRSICNTITSATGGGGNTDVYVNNIRRLTPVECERLQGYPDNYTQYGNFDGKIKLISDSQRYKMLGNSVTAKIVELVGKSILKQTNK